MRAASKIRELHQQPFLFSRRNATRILRFQQRLALFRIWPLNTRSTATFSTRRTQATLNSCPVSANVSASDLEALAAIEKSLLWLSSYVVHNANNVRAKKDPMKVGGHQASCHSMTTILTALYFRVLNCNDRVAVKPHASPVYHSIQYLLGHQTIDQLERFRGLGGIQSYPSRTKDQCEVDFSTGSVGLGAAITTFAALTQDFLSKKHLIPSLQSDSPENKAGRMICLVGDAELDEGNIYEALLEASKLDIRNNWWIIDYNRQSLDNISPDGGDRQVDRLFRAHGFTVVPIKYGKKLLALFNSGAVGTKLRKWFGALDNSEYSALCFNGGKAFRKRLKKDFPKDPEVAGFLKQNDDRFLFGVFTNLGGHCMETLVEAFTFASQSDNRTVFIAHTIKGYGTPLAGHRDNHGLYMNSTQISKLQKEVGVPEGAEWTPLEGFPPKVRENINALLSTCAFGPSKPDRDLQAEIIPIPELACEKIASTSTQNAFGQIMLTIGKSEAEYSKRVLTTAPDVSTSTNLSGFTNYRGVFSREEKEDRAQKQGIMSANKWTAGPSGQHIPLGIAEMNLMLMLSAAGLSAKLFGHRLLPIGTVYDPFVARGLDALIYGCYQNSRFIVVGTPSGVTLAPEGGAHQSIGTPLIGMSLPGLISFEPAYADELEVLMEFALTHLQADDGCSVYFRLSTRMVDQPEREMTTQLREHIIQGAYYHGILPSSENPPACVIAFVGALAPNAIEAHARINEHLRNTKGGYASLLQVTSPDRLNNDWADKKKLSSVPHVESLLENVPSHVPIVTLHDAHPAALSWLGSVNGNRVRGLGVTSFGQSGDLPDIHRFYNIDANSVYEAALEELEKS